MDYGVTFLLALADKYPIIATCLIVVGFLYAALTALRGVLTAGVKLTKTTVDDTVIAAVFAFLDKFSYGFGKLEEYYESKTKSSDDSKTE